MNDNKTTIPTDMGAFAHNYSMANDDKYRAGYEAKQEWEKGLGKQSLEDQSLMMLLAADGMVPLTAYSMPPIHAAGRVVRAVQYKDPKRLFGIPGATELKNAIKSAGKDRDKVLWRGTANIAKVDGMYGLD